MIELGFGDYRVAVQMRDYPVAFSHWKEHAAFHDIEGLKNEGDAIFIGVGKGKDWYDLVIAFRTSPLDQSGFSPGILIVPETETLFVGAGEVIRTYDLKTGQLKLDKPCHMGFWGWNRVDDMVVCSEELEFGVFTAHGLLVWSTFVEPPWEWSVEDGNVRLDIMGTIRKHDLKTGKMI